MPTSGSSDFLLTTNDIYTVALQMNGVCNDMQQPTASQISLCKKIFNSALKSLSKNNTHAYKIETITKKITASSKVLGTDGYDYECIKSHTSTTASVPATGESYLLYWKKLATTTASAHALSTAYTSITEIDLPDDVVAIDSIILRDTDSNDTNISIGNIADYNINTNKLSESTPNIAFFSRKRQSTGSSTQTTQKNKLYLYPYPSTSEINSILIINVLRAIQDADNAVDSLDTMQEGLLPLTYVLARHLHNVYKVMSPTEFSQFKAEHDTVVNQWLGNIGEYTDLNFTVDI